MIQLAWRSSVQLPRSTTIAGRATAVIISSRPGEEDAGAQDGEQDERNPAVHALSVGPRGAAPVRRPAPAATAGCILAVKGAP